jgi:hypothetical protein
MMLQIKHAFELAQLYLHANFKKNIKKLTRKTNFFLYSYSVKVQV